MLRIDIKPSKQFIVLMTIMIGISLGIEGFLPLSFWLKIPLLLGSFIYGFQIFKEHIFLKSRKAIIQLEKREEDWRITTGSEFFYGKILGSSLLTPKLCILRFKNAGAIHSVVIFKDAMDPEIYRKMLVSMRG